jgi:tRNA U34 5-carboxymethylaminomethyl modifying GTPase MnmE/TrmE
MDARYTVRRATPADAPSLLRLMRELARFEGYLEQFRVSADDLLGVIFSRFCIGK